jgi:hypothetical protein
LQSPCPRHTLPVGGNPIPNEMADKTEFEEPEYEGPLYNQLLSSSLNIWTPGRRFERVFGIDSAVLSQNHFFWSLFGQSAPLVGTSLRNYQWHFLWRFISRTIRPVPKFQVNLLIQSKRPADRKGVNGGYAAHGIRGEYWQFSMTPHQQKILLQLESKLGTDALVVYACPAFHKFEDLERHIENGQIIENSTFVKPHRLRGHSKWVFDKPGTAGLACSKIEEHSDKPFFSMLQEAFEVRGNEKREYSNYYYSQLVRVVDQICDEESNTIGIKIFKRRNANLKEFLNDELFNQPFDSKNEKQNFIDLMSFTQFVATFNIDWFEMY